MSGSRKRFLAELETYATEREQAALEAPYVRFGKSSGLSPGMNREQTISSLKERSDNAKLETAHGAVGLGGVGLLAARYAPGVKPAAKKALEHASLGTAVIGGGIGGAYALRRAATDRKNIAAQRAQLGVSKGSGTVDPGVPPQTKWEYGHHERKGRPLVRDRKGQAVRFGLHPVNHGQDTNPYRWDRIHAERKAKANSGEHAAMQADAARDARNKYYTTPAGKAFLRRSKPADKAIPSTATHSYERPQHWRENAKDTLAWERLQDRPFENPPRTLSGRGQGKITMGRRKDESRPYIIGKKDSNTPLHTTIDESDAKKLVERHGLTGALPKQLTREQRMSVYEARYVSAGGHKANKWQHRANTADKVKTGGLAVATAGGAGWLATRGRMKAKIKPKWAHHAETAAGAGATIGGAGELYGDYARRKRSSYASAPSGVAASALRRMRGYSS